MDHFVPIREKSTNERFPISVDRNTYEKISNIKTEFGLSCAKVVAQMVDFCYARLPGQLVDMPSKNNPYMCTAEELAFPIGADAAKAVEQFSADDVYIGGFWGVREASRITGVSPSAISACCRGERNSAGGFRWAWRK